MQPTDRKAPCPCGSGRRYKNCCYAKDRARQVPREAARAGLACVDAVLDVLLPLVESHGEMKIACGAGCNACCNSFVRCSLPEALLVADWLRLPENAEILQRFRDKLPRWRETAGDLAAQLTELLAQGAGTPAAGAEWQRFNQLSVEYGLRQNLCPLNHEGRCEIYPVRPTICRSVHVLDTSEYCTPGRGREPKVLSHPKLEEAVREATAGFARASEDAVERSIPEAIAWALEFSS